MGLQQFEQRLERLVEGVFAKAFRGELQPIEIGRKLTREMDLQRTVSVNGIIVPNHFAVELSAEDYERFGGFGEVLSRELAEAAREHARAEGYAFAGVVEVAIAENPQLARSTFAITGEVVESEDKPVGWLVLADGRRVAIAAEEVTIGRLPDCEIALADPNASRRHAQVRRDGDSAVLLDLDSTNGTRVNGSPVRQRRLRDGDVIGIGMSTITYRAD